MFRRRRRVREIPFSFDSFLDIVANVVGVIIRLILVVWVGARSYSSLKHIVVPDAPAAEPMVAVGPIEDPLQNELEAHRRELARIQAELLAQLRHLESAQVAPTRVKSELAALAAR